MFRREMLFNCQNFKKLARRMVWHSNNQNEDPPKTIIKTDLTMYDWYGRGWLYLLVKEPPGSTSMGTMEPQGLASLSIYCLISCMYVFRNNWLRLLNYFSAYGTEPEAIKYVETYTKMQSMILYYWLLCYLIELGSDPLRSGEPPRGHNQA